MLIVTGASAFFGIDCVVLVILFERAFSMRCCLKYKIQVIVIDKTCKK